MYLESKLGLPPPVLFPFLLKKTSYFRASLEGCQSQPLTNNYRGQPIIDGSNGSDEGVSTNPPNYPKRM
ncbi:hypothetical protein METBIDRAFT_31659 [Metschnikowia bicuspidata var. bicuspidata NRRL YB-4993]|uniref:Uncharacterized protein n=1 Tax=Metschnikowia bicuspidata var. bicuspidata NRRL YB-4993 TaxID=869754 RepID=A0A1A0HAY0_9ASCO|nr:hypothetical protein METBIDRAFT_31659 [Metschnikowia bicuspidata var. bicuspidata NRRL YB-4993]OBA21037.1 hypothetical protein METBIDRAFT_31659 [Metschnikowia bicuspidata var. bicuspidata NRRL YB-4993]